MPEKVVINLYFWCCLGRAWQPALAFSSINERPGGIQRKSGECERYYDEDEDECVVSVKVFSEPHKKHKILHQYAMND